MLITGLPNFLLTMFYIRKTKTNAHKKASSQNKLIPLQMLYILFIRFQITKWEDERQIKRSCSLTCNERECHRRIIIKTYICSYTEKATLSPCDDAHGL